ncbi:MAG: FUSC family protein [Galbitalea sp.]
MRLRLDAKIITQRAARSIPAAVQIVAGVLISYSIAHFLIGHATPLLSVTVVISTLGFARDARPRRVLESTIGILIGIFLSEALVLVVGHGVWQIAVVLFVTLVIARSLSASPAFAVASATQGMLVMILPTSQGGPFARSEDALVAGVVALLMTALVPRDTRKIAIRDARNLASVLAQAMTSLVESVTEANEPAASLAVDRLRKTQELVNNWATSLDSALAVARISPFLRRQLPELRRQAALLTGFDLAARHLRVIARRVYFLLREGGGRAELGELLGSIAVAIELLGAGIEQPARLGEAAAALRELAPRLDPEKLMPGAPVTESVLVLLARPLVVDLLIAAGTNEDEARALLPVV